jgi:chromosome segregation ATPase
MLEKKVDLKNYSRSNFTTDQGTTEMAQLGAVLRIADSLEKIEKPFVELLEKVKNQEERMEFLRMTNRKLNDENDKLTHRIRGYKGEITKLKLEIEALKKPLDQE